MVLEQPLNLAESDPVGLQLRQRIAAEKTDSIGLVTSLRGSTFKIAFHKDFVDVLKCGGMVVLGLVEDREKFQCTHAISTLFKSLARGNLTGAFPNIRPAARKRPQTESPFPDKEKLVVPEHNRSNIHFRSGVSRSKSERRNYFFA